MSSVDITPLYGGLPFNQWMSIHTCALIVIILSMCGSSNIIYLSVVAARKRTLDMTQKFPLFISIADLLFGIFHGSDHVASLIQGRVTTGPTCVFLGFGTVYSMNISPFWISSCAAYVFYFVTKNRSINFGRGDWGLHLFNWGIPFAINIIALAQGKFGPEGAWCGLPDSLWAFNGLIISIGLGITAVCYALIFLKISRIIKASNEAKTSEIGLHSLTQKSTNITDRTKNNLILLDCGVQPLESKLQQTAYNLPKYVVVFIIQWIPYATYAILMNFGKEYFELDLFTVILVNSGGIWNAMVYRKLILKEMKKPAVQNGQMSSGHI
ncbi:hypothetical protein HDU84_000583 [Entophlyctis sp. JEL0112]|nr:hypothetical protein HDU84_000583 [Entophlyctis sp. JEL0112]